MAKKKTSQGKAKPKVNATSKTPQESRAKAKAEEPACKLPPEPKAPPKAETTFVAIRTDKVPRGQGAIVHARLSKFKAGATEQQLVDAIRKNNNYPLKKGIELRDSVHYHLLKFQRLEIISARG